MFLKLIIKHKTSYICISLSFINHFDNTFSDVSQYIFFFFDILTKNLKYLNISLCLSLNDILQTKNKKNQ